MQKQNMTFASSSYAQVAGIQSEVNKVTVTRVAGGEVEYQRQMNLYRKDMEIVVRNLRKEQKKLRKAIVRYSRRLHEGRRERARREVEGRVRDRHCLENMQKVSEIINMQDTQILSIIKEKNSDLEDAFPENEVGHESEERVQEETEKQDQIDDGAEDKHAKELPEQVGDRSEIILPPISAPLTCNDNELPDWGNDNATMEERTLPEITVNSELETKLSKHFRTLKPKKQAVSYSDIIKLQHSTNPQKLFSLVNKLAQKHGIKDESPEQVNTSLPRGTRDRSVPSKAGSGLHAMNYGYNITSRQDHSLPSLKVDRHSLSDGHLEIAQGRHDTYSAEKSSEISTHVKSPKSTLLPAIHKLPPEETFSYNKRSEKRGPISWTEAIALIKSVHSL